MATQTQGLPLSPVRKSSRPTRRVLYAFVTRANHARSIHFFLRPAPTSGTLFSFRFSVSHTCFSKQRRTAQPLSGPPPTSLHETDRRLHKANVYKGVAVNGPNKTQFFALTALFSNSGLLSGGFVPASLPVFVPCSWLERPSAKRTSAESFDDPLPRHPHGSHPRGPALIHSRMCSIAPYSINFLLRGNAPALSAKSAAWDESG